MFLYNSKFQYYSPTIKKINKIYSTNNYSVLAIDSNSPLIKESLLMQKRRQRDYEKKLFKHELLEMSRNPNLSDLNLQHRANNRTRQFKSYSDFDISSMAASIRAKNDLADIRSKSNYDFDIDPNDYSQEVTKFFRNRNLKKKITKKDLKIEIPKNKINKDIDEIKLKLNSSSVIKKDLQATNIGKFIKSLEDKKINTFATINKGSSINETLLEKSNSKLSKKKTSTALSNNKLIKSKNTDVLQKKHINFNNPIKTVYEKSNDRVLNSVKIRNIVTKKISDYKKPVIKQKTNKNDNFIDYKIEDLTKFNVIKRNKLSNLLKNQENNAKEVKERVDLLMKLKQNNKSIMKSKIEKLENQRKPKTVIEETVLSNDGQQKIDKYLFKRQKLEKNDSSRVSVNTVKSSFDNIKRNLKNFKKNYEINMINKVNNNYYYNPEIENYLNNNKKSLNNLLETIKFWEYKEYKKNDISSRFSKFIPEHTKIVSQPLDDKLKKDSNLSKPAVANEAETDLKGKRMINTVFANKNGKLEQENIGEKPVEVVKSKENKVSSTAANTIVKALEKLQDICGLSYKKWNNNKVKLSKDTKISENSNKAEFVLSPPVAKSERKYSFFGQNERENLFKIKSDLNLNENSKIAHIYAHQAHKSNSSISTFAK